jgi:hypothetical protein
LPCGKTPSFLRSWPARAPSRQNNRWNAPLAVKSAAAS